MRLSGVAGVGVAQASKLRRLLVVGTMALVLVTSATVASAAVPLDQGTASADASTGNSGGADAAVSGGAPADENATTSGDADGVKQENTNATTASSGADDSGLAK